MTRKILVIDGNSILNRAFYGIRPLTNKDGLQTNAVYGMVNIILKHLESVKPDYAAVAFDLKAPTFRHKMFSEYKAGRHAMPNELAVQLPYAKRVCELLGLKVISLEGYEADDIIGTIAEYANRSDDILSYVLTGDRDSLQLIRDNINVLLAGNNDTVKYDRTAFNEKYGVEPETFVDVKALMGDTSDNIPGVAGIGEKTALKLISDFGSLDKVYENIDSDKIAKGVRTKLTDGRDSAYLSQRLAKIDCNVPIEESLDLIEYKGFDKSGLLELFTELEFGALIKRLGLDEASVTDAEASVNQSAYSEKKSTLEEIRQILTESKIAALAINRADANFILAISNNGVENHTCNADKADCESIITEFAEKLIVYDSKNIFNITDIDPLTKFGFDIKLAAYVADSSVGKYELDRLALKYLGENYTGDEFNAALIFKLYKPLYNELVSTEALSVLTEIEQPLAGILSDMEKEGCKIDSHGLTAFGQALGRAADELAAKIYETAGCEFNINSPKQLGEVLFERLGLPSFKKTK